MAAGLIGRKCGMTRVFTETGDSIPVTIVQVLPNYVTQLKTVEQDGYAAIQVSAIPRAVRHVNKPLAGHFAKANVEAGKVLKEFRLTPEELSGFSVGDTLTAERFQVGEFVDVSGRSKGKGFAGCVKRHNFRTQDATHGNSLSHRAPGSIGQNQTPGRVFKNKKMAGHMGDVKKTIQSLEIVGVDAEKHLLLVKGGVPGAPGTVLVVTSSVKRQREAA